MSSSDPLGMGEQTQQGKPAESPEDQIAREEQERQVKANNEWVKTTEVWYADENGSEDFDWFGHHIAVPRPPGLSWEQNPQGVLVVDEGKGALYQTWADKYLPEDFVVDFSHPISGMGLQHWWFAKRWLHWKLTGGKWPEFKPPFPHAPGGRSRAGIG